MRAEIGSDGEVVRMLSGGDRVVIEKAFNGWYYVSTGVGTSGWCMSCHVDTDINGYDRSELAKKREDYIGETLKDAENTKASFRR